ncbi:MAG TPA: DinB family protein [Candidatus Acidoferrales bacterium]|nr:DinB family protein [Candidatus Acidoferrales bacterium]
MKKSTSLVVFAALLAVAFSSAVAQQKPPASTAQSIRGQFMAVDKSILDMAKDFPADKYSFKLKPEMRSFGEVIVHVASGNAYAAKFGRGEDVKWDELDPKNYKSKDEIVALLEKSISDSETVMKGWPDDEFAKRVQPWLGVLEHSAEHYGLLVAYYRANGMVPPASRQGN